ncbi:MAG: hypothetical protein QGG64_16000 [Candidatus Latescibacteria bacterium]|nr:hypothetical protein [Candidatus Latescibacterota bacterium]
MWDIGAFWPHVLIAKAEEMAKLLEPERFEGLSLDELIRTVEVGEAPIPFIAALEDCYERFCGIPPDILRLVRNTFRGGLPIAQVAKEASQRREAVVDEVRESLASSADALVRFERLHDWTLFWGPALNHRIPRGNVPVRKLRRLFRKMQEVLLADGLVDDVADVVFFTVQDLKVIAVTGDIAQGRRLLQKRKLEYEHSNRLVAPAFLGKPPDDGSTSEPGFAPDANETGAEMGIVIIGKPVGPGRIKGIVRRVNTLQEGDDVGGEEDVVVVVKLITSNNNDVTLLFSLLLRVRALIIPPARWLSTNHISQIARECSVPVVQVAPPDLKRLIEGRRVDVDGMRGIVTLTDT